MTTALALDGRLAPGGTFPDLELPDHTGRLRSLSEIAGGDPVALHLARLVVPQGAALPSQPDDAPGRVRGRVYAKLVVLSVDPPEVQAAFRAGLGARFPFLSDSERAWLDELGLREATDTVHHPYLPAAFTLFPDLRIHRVYNGYWFWGRPTPEDLRRDMREFSMRIRPDWTLV